MRPLLTVAVPTYNRVESLETLTDDFLLPASRMEEVDVVVCDNSDDEAAGLNQRLFSGTGVRYHRNARNLGFHGNLLQCIERASGQWLWIISDDDAVDLDAFTEFVDALKAGWAGDARGAMLPYWVTGTSNDGTERRSLTNTCETWGGNGTLRELVARSKVVPFILFSSVVLRLSDSRKADIPLVFERYQPNDYMQVMLFGHLLGWDAIVHFWKRPLQVYRHAHEGRFPFRGMAESMDRVLEYLGQEAGVSADAAESMQRKKYHGWSIWYAKHRAGEVKIQEADAAFIYLLARSFRLVAPKAVLLLLAARLLPANVFSNLWRRMGL